MSIQNPHLTRNILIAMILGIILGLCLNFFAHIESVQSILVNGILDVGGKIFIAVLKMLVVPVVLISLVCGSSQMQAGKKIGFIAVKTFLLYLLTTAIAITLALTIAHALHLGVGSHFSAPQNFQAPKAPSLKQTIINIIPHNPIDALAKGNMLQIIVFALLIGFAISYSGESGKHIRQWFVAINDVIINLINLLLKIAPLGVFCLITTIFAKTGFSLIKELLSYFLTVFLVLAVHFLLTNSILLQLFARLNPWQFFKRIFSAMLFAFSTASSNASIPVVLETAQEKLGVNNKIASFTIPLGATINMDGTAIMQGVATVFIANLYHVPITMVGYLSVILTATLASIGTAGVPGVGLITLAMVLKQVGLPVEGIALIMGVDRLLDMARTAVNIAGDLAVSCVVGKSERALDKNIYSA